MQYRPAPTTPAATGVSLGQRGFKLFELMAAVAVLAILAALSAPNFSEFMAARRAADASEVIASTLRLARIQAIETNSPATVRIQPGVATITNGARLAGRFEFDPRLYLFGVKTFAFSTSGMATSSGSLTIGGGYPTTIRFVDVSPAGQVTKG